jgi:hypothetical protein
MKTKTTKKIIAPQPTHVVEINTYDGRTGMPSYITLFTEPDLKQYIQNNGTKNILTVYQLGKQLNLTLDTNLI